MRMVFIQALFYGLYWFLFRHYTSHGLNRLYLISSLLLSVFIPLIENPFPKEIAHIPYVDMTELMGRSGEVIPVNTKTSEPLHHFPTWQIVSNIYLFLMGLLLLRSLLHLYFLQKIKHQSEYVRKQWFKLFKTTRPSPFSFFSNVFIPKAVFDTPAFEQILEHECVHVRQLHSLDRLLLDLLVALFWFNPFIYWYRKALIEVHEFQADAQVIKRFNSRIAYQEILFAQLQPAPYSGLVSHFNFRTIKKRIVMMNKSQNTRKPKLIYALSLPLLVMMLLAFTSRKGHESAASISHTIEAVTAPFTTSDRSVPIQDVSRYEPSILPLRASETLKITSAFGSRRDPFTNKGKLHKGIDLSTAIGTEVLATADGVVESVDHNADGYGKMIVLNHNHEYLTVYSQLSDIKVRTGEKIHRGEVIALSGNSGKSTGPHLHYEVHKNGKAVDPAAYIHDYEFRFTNEPAEGIEIDHEENINFNPDVDKEKQIAIGNLQQSLIEKQKSLGKIQISISTLQKSLAETQKSFSTNSLITTEMLETLNRQRLELHQQQEKLAMAQEEMAREQSRLAHVKRELNQVLRQTNTREE